MTDTSDPRAATYEEACASRQCHREEKRKNEFELLDLAMLGIKIEEDEVFTADLRIIASVERVHGLSSSSRTETP